MVVFPGNKRLHINMVIFRSGMVLTSLLRSFDTLVILPHTNKTALAHFIA